MKKVRDSGHEQQSPNFLTFKEPKNRFQGTNSTRLCSLAGRYDNPVPTRFLAPMDSLKIPALIANDGRFKPALAERDQKQTMIDLFGRKRSEADNDRSPRNLDKLVLKNPVMSLHKAFWATGSVSSSFCPNESLKPVIYLSKFSFGHQLG